MTNSLTFTSNYSENLCTSTQILLLSTNDNSTGTCSPSCPSTHYMAPIVSTANVYLCYESTQSPTPHNGTNSSLATDMKPLYYFNTIPGCATYLTPGECLSCTTGTLGIDCTVCAEGWLLQGGRCLQNYVTIEDSVEGMLVNESKIGSVNSYTSFDTLGNQSTQPYCKPFGRFNLNSKIELCRSMYMYSMDPSNKSFVIDISYFIGVDIYGSILYRPIDLFYFVCHNDYLTDEILYYNQHNGVYICATGGLSVSDCGGSYTDIFDINDGSSYVDGSNTYSQIIKKLGAKNYMQSYFTNGHNNATFSEYFKHYSSNTYTFVLDCGGELQRFYYNFGKFAVTFKSNTDSFINSQTTYVSCSKGYDFLNSYLTSIEFVYDETMYSMFASPDANYYTAVFDNVTLETCTAGNNLCQLAAGSAYDTSFNYHFNHRVRILNKPIYKITRNSNQPEDYHYRFYKLKVNCAFNTYYLKEYYIKYNAYLEDYNEAMQLKTLTTAQKLASGTFEDDEYVGFAMSPPLTIENLEDYYNFSDSDLEFSFVPKTKFQLVNHPFYKRYYECPEYRLCKECVWSFYRDATTGEIISKDYLNNDNLCKSLTLFIEDYHKSKSTRHTLFKRVQKLFNQPVIDSTDKIHTNGKFKYILSETTSGKTTYLARYLYNNYVPLLSEFNSSSDYYYFMCNHWTVEELNAMANIDIECANDLPTLPKNNVTTNYYCLSNFTTRLEGNCFKCIMRIGCMYGDVKGRLEVSDENFKLEKEQDKTCNYHFDDPNQTGNGSTHHYYSLYLRDSVTYPKFAYDVQFKCTVDIGNGTPNIVAVYNANLTIYINNGDYKFTYLADYINNDYNTYNL